ncbi:MAG: glycosyltransferase family 39 protein [Leptospirales bacterium]|nr:glycosyltransferase family 39 protein [Leptospirales bacterium]
MAAIRTLGIRRCLLPALLALAYFLMQYGANAFHGFGYFVDELYYLACAARPAAGYVDHPPLSILLLTITTGLLGDSLVAIRFIPAAAGAGAVFVTGMIARRLGGGPSAVLLSGLAVMGAPVLLVLFGFYSMNSLEVLIWNAIVWIVIVLLQEEKPKLWIAVGILGGLGVENKHTFGVFIGALLIGLALSGQLYRLRSPYPWIGGLAALLLLIPNLVWQQTHGWASIEFYRNATLLKNLQAPPWKVLFDQILAANPGSLALWCGGLFFFLRRPETRKLRAFGWLFLLLLAGLIATQSSRPDRIAAAYPALFAGGACFFERIGRRWIMPAALSVVLLTGIVFLPAGLPILPPAALARYAAAIGVIPQIERGQAAALPQWFANRFDWDVMYESVKGAYDALPDDERKEAVVLGAFYGHAGALERFGRGSIPVISGHNSYHTWGYGNASGQIVIAVGFRKEDLLTEFEEVKQVGSYSRRYSVDANVPIYLCRRLKSPLPEAWKRLRFFV